MKNKVNRAFMAKKKQYICPLVEVAHFETESLMHVDSPSNTEFPGGPIGAPSRRGSNTDVF